MLDFTRCMRDNGVEMPDLAVDADGQARVPTDALASIDTESPEFTEAFVVCVPNLTEAGAVSLATDPELLLPKKWLLLISSHRRLAKQATDTLAAWGT